jgi:hypothetical protein
MSKQVSRQHHFVPQFLLRPWAVQDMLRGYWWDVRHGELASKHRGTKSFCRQLDLLTLNAHGLGRDALEKIFFGEIDSKGAKARNELLTSGPSGLTKDQRCDFARLLLSLEARRPSNVTALRAESRTFAEGLDNDPEIIAAMEAEGLTDTPSSFYERGSGVLLEDRALKLIQRLVDNPTVGSKLINAQWHIIRLGRFDGSFILSDRPLIRLRGYEHPGAVWVLPLTPQVSFVAVNHPENLRKIQRVTPQRFSKKTNVSSAHQAERFVFCVDKSHEHWIGKYLCASAR